MLAVNLLAKDTRYDQLYLSNFATIEVRDALMRIEGVGDVSMLGARDYSMRVWLDPQKLAVKNLTAGDVLTALREQNVQVAAGRIGQEPALAGQEFQLAISTKGRLLEPEQFDAIVVKGQGPNSCDWAMWLGRNSVVAIMMSAAPWMDNQALPWPCFNCRALTR